jgi:hypothetical protein
MEEYGYDGSSFDAHHHHHHGGATAAETNEHAGAAGSSGTSMFLSQQEPVVDEQVDFDDPDIAALPRILLMGPRRGGKTSIQVWYIMLFDIFVFV